MVRVANDSCWHRVYLYHTRENLQEQTVFFIVQNKKMVYLYADDFIDALAVYTYDSDYGLPEAIHA
jgi:hypothetical protein